MESLQKKISRVRKPRVHIVYDVETEGAVVQKDLPFVVGVMGDFAGNASDNTKAYKDRKFVQIDRDNFNDVMTNISPKLNFKVDNTLQNDGSELSIDLEFKSMESFEPAAIIQQVEPLKKLLEARNKLRDLTTKADRSENLEAILEKILQDNSQLMDVAKDLGLEK